MMKKLLSLTLAAVMMFSLTACGAKTDSPNPTGSTATEVTQESNAKNEDAKKLDVDLTKVEGEITISNFQYMPVAEGQQPFLDTAAKEFEAKYPGTKINIQNTGKPMEIKQAQTDEGSSAAITGFADLNQNLVDYSKQVNVDLMSGGGADIYALANVLPTMQLADQGFLEDLNAYMTADSTFDASQYYTNIFDGSEYKNGLYEIPVDFMFSYISMSTKLIPEDMQKEILAKNGLTLDDVFVYGDKVRSTPGNEKTPVFSVPVDSLISSYNNLNQNDFIDFQNKKVSYDNGEFEKMLETYIQYSKDGVILASIDMASGTMDVSKLTEAMSQPAAFYTGSYNLMPTEFLYNSDLLKPEVKTSLDSMFGNRERAGLLLNNQGKAAYSALDSFGINANSKNKALAWAFIKFLLEKDTQQSMSLLGVPVLKSALPDKYTPYFSVDYIMTRTGDPNSITLNEDEEKVKDSFVQTLDGFIGNLNYATYSDSTVTNILDKQLEKYYTGEQSAKDTTDAIQNAVELYINEQQ